MDNNELRILAIRATQRCKLDVTGREVERVLSLLLTNSTIWTLYQFSAQPIKQVQAVLHVLAESGLVHWSTTGPCLTEAGLSLAGQLRLEPAIHPVCSACNGRGITTDLELSVRDQFVEIQQQRPGAQDRFVQGFVTPECTLARVQFAIERGDVAGKDILVLGAEDDLVGLALALTRKPHKVTVLDLDARLVAFDNHWAEKLHLPLEARMFDLRNPLPCDWLAAFDTFVTDPPETELAIRGFVLRGVAALKEPGATGYFGFTFHDSSLNKWWRLQQTLNKHRLVITDLLPSFNVYQNFGYIQETPAYTGIPAQPLPEKPWFVSHWFRITALHGFTGENANLAQAGHNFCTDAETMTDTHGQPQNWSQSQVEDCKLPRPHPTRSPG